AVDDPEVHGHEPRVLPTLGETQVGVESAFLPGKHLGDELLAGLRDLAALQLFVHAAALLEPAALQVLLPARLGEAFLEDALASRPSSVSSWMLSGCPRRTRSAL